MKRTLKYALSTVLSAAVVTPVLAQDQFPDVPENHWAYEALRTMKSEGLLVGYPDGLFRGGRPASRYELAVAIHATYQRLKGITDGLATQIKAVEQMRNTGGASQADLDNLKSQLAQLQSDMNSMKAWGDDIANLKRLTATFEKELASQGVDVAKMQKGLDDISARVGILEKNALPITIHGDVNLLAIGGYSQSDDFGLSIDSRPTGVGRGDYDGAPVGITRDLSIFHEAALNFAGTNTEGPTWKATVVLGNMLGEGGFYNQNEVIPGFVSGSSVSGNFFEGDQDVYIQNLAVMFNTGLLGTKFSAEVGRVDYSISPYIFMRPDNTPYYSNERWDNGRWLFDGGILGFNFGSAKLNVFGGRNSNRTTTNGTPIQSMGAGALDNMWTAGDDRPRGLMSGVFSVDQSLGLHLNLPVTQNGSVNLAYVWLDSDNVVTVGTSPTVLANGVNVLGGDIRFNFGGPVVEAGYSQSNVRYNGDNVVDEDNAAWFARIGWKQDKWGVTAGYRAIEPLFAAPGWWGRIGDWYNPTDIEGFQVKAHFDLNESIRLMAEGEFYKGTDTDINGVVGFGEDDKINTYKIGVAYKLHGGWDLGLGYEYVEYDLADRSATSFVGGKPRGTWWNIGFGYNLSENTAVKLHWQISDWDSKGVAGFGPFGGNSGNRARGGVAVAQLSLKF